MSETKMTRIRKETHHNLRVLAALKGVTMIDMLEELVSGYPPSLADVEALLMGVAKRLGADEITVGLRASGDSATVVAVLAPDGEGWPFSYERHERTAERLDWAVDKLQAAIEAAKETPNETVRDNR